MLGGNNEGNEANDIKVHASINIVASQHSFDMSSFMCALVFDAMQTPKIFKFVNPSISFVQDGEFAVRMEFSSRETIVISIRNYTLFKGVDYKVYESKSLTFYAKYLQYGTISQDHSKLDSDTIADVIRPLVEVGPSLKAYVNPFMRVAKATVRTTTRGIHRHLCSRLANIANRNTRRTGI
ncbi:hypothetical protein AHAS_Ahas15G0282200 [Arachis hypogaea]